MAFFSPCECCTVAFNCQQQHHLRQGTTMSRMHVLLLGLWLRPALTFELNSPFAAIYSFSLPLEFSQFAIHNQSGVSELQPNTEPTDGLLEGTPDNSWLFTEFLSSDVQSWDDSDNEARDIDILVRQTRRCPPGTCTSCRLPRLSSRG